MKHIKTEFSKKSYSIIFPRISFLSRITSHLFYFIKTLKSCNYEDLKSFYGRFNVSLVMFAFQPTPNPLPCRYLFHVIFFFVPSKLGIKEGKHIKNANRCIWANKSRAKQSNRAQVKIYNNEAHLKLYCPVDPIVDAMIFLNKLGLVVGLQL